jgi:hypothetical protein
VPQFSTTWLNNFMTVMDADGYSGYTAFAWVPPEPGCGSLQLLTDWNGNPSGYG